MNTIELEARVKELEAKLANSHKTDYDALVKFIIDNRSSYSSRRLLAKACEAQGLCKESSAFHYLSFQNYVEAYVKYVTK
jgi:hypothetical protein